MRQSGANLMSQIERLTSDLFAIGKRPGTAAARRRVVDDRIRELLEEVAQRAAEEIDGEPKAASFLGDCRDAIGQALNDGSLPDDGVLEVLDQAYVAIR